MGMIDNLALTRIYISEHPFSGPQDIYKLLYQIYLGPEHLLADPEKARESLYQEFESIEPESGKIFQVIKKGQEIIRLNLAQYKAAGGNISQVWDALLETSRTFEKRIEEFKMEWEYISDFLQSTGYWDDEELEVLDKASAEHPPVPMHHSAHFVKKENPHYRIVSINAIKKLDGKLDKMLRQQIKDEVYRMPDVQQTAPKHPFQIDKVGISKLIYPIVVLDRESEKQHTIAEITMSIELPGEWRGTHMSRFLEILNQYRGEITYVQIERILKTMQEVFDAESAHITLAFPYFIEKSAPISGAKSIMKYDARFNGILDNDDFKFWVGLTLPVMTLCPCSKEISERGAHSQRTYIDIEVRSPEFVWLEDLIEIAEKAGSASIYELLKREDEKYISDLAYDNPKFVEDVVRQVCRDLSNREDIEDFRVRACSEESIHNHMAFAEITSKKK